MARAVYKHVGSFRKANRISAIGSQAHPRTGGAKEGRGAQFFRAMKLESTGVWPNKASGGWGANTPVHSSPTTKGSRSQAHQKGIAGSRVWISDQTRKGWSRDGLPGLRFSHITFRYLCDLPLSDMAAFCPGLLLNGGGMSVGPLGELHGNICDSL